MYNNNMKRGEVALSASTMLSINEVEGQKQWYVYILECREGSFYTGITYDIDQRLQDHKKRKVHYTSYKLPIKVVFCEKHPSQKIAARRETQIKGWTRKKKIALIRGDLVLLKEL